MSIPNSKPTLPQVHMITKKLVLVIVMLIGVIELFVASAYFAYKFFTTTSVMFKIRSSRGPESLESIDHYLALLSFIGALALLVFVKKYWRSK